MILRTSIYTLITSIIKLIFGVLASILVARILGPEGKGMLTALLLLPGFLAYIAKSGLGTANVFFSAKKENIDEIAGNSLIFILIVTPLFLIFFLPFRFWYVKTYLNGNISFMYLSLILFPIYLCIILFSNIIRGKKKFFSYNIIDGLRSLLKFILLFILIYILSQGVKGALKSHLFSESFIAILFIISVLRISNWNIHINWNLLKKNLKYGIKSHIGDLLLMLNQRLDFWLVGYFLMDKGLGLYSISVGIGELLWIIPYAINLPFFPLKAENKDINSAKIVRNSFIIMLFSAIILGISGWYLIPIFYGKAFIPSVVPFLILLPGLVFWGTARVIFMHFLGEGKPVFLIYFTAPTLIINILLDIWLIPLWHINGGAVASSVSYIIGGLITFIIFKKKI